MLTLEFEGETYNIPEDVFVSDDGKTYEAYALNENGDEFIVYWLVTHPDFENMEDASEACDWDVIHRVRPC